VPHSMHWFKLRSNWALTRLKNLHRYPIRPGIHRGWAQNRAQSQARCRTGARKLLIGMVRPARLERATSWFVARRSIQLS
jgi:hypothetical protein